MPRNILVTTALLALAGCLPVTANSFHYTADEFPSNYEDLIRSDLDANLVDPTSLMRLRIGTPTWRENWRGLAYGGGTNTYWVVCASYNSKNQFGGYTGQQHTEFWIASGRVVARWGFSNCVL